MPTRPTSPPGAGTPASGISLATGQANFPSTVTSVFVATSPTQASIQAAISLAQASGGGTVMMPDAGATGIVVTTVGFTLSNGLSLVGVPPRYGYGNASGLADSGLYFTGGTWFTSVSGVSFNQNSGLGSVAGFSPIFGSGTGTQSPASFPCFWDGATNTGTQPASTAAYSASTTSSSVRMVDIGIAGFSIGVSTGAQNVAGAMYSEFRNIFIEGCSQWGFYLTNPLHTKAFGIYCFGNGQGDGLTGNGMVQGWVAQSIMQPGNCLLYDLYGFTMPTATVPHSIWNRGWVFQALCPDTTTNASLNEINVTRVQQNSFGRTPVTFTATPQASTGNLLLNVTNPQNSVVLNQPVQTTTASNPNGFRTYETYFVIAITPGASGTITLSTTINSAGVQPSATTAMTMVSAGFPNIEIVGNNNASSGSATVIANSLFTGVDAEGITQAGCLMLNCGQTKLLMGNVPGQANKPDICARNSNYCIVESPGITITDYDVLSTLFTHIGPRGTIIQRTGLGIWYDSVLGTYVLGLNPAGLGNVGPMYLRQPASDSFFYPSGSAMGVQVYESNAVTVAFVSLGTDCLAVGSSNSTWTLPTLANASNAASSLGRPYYLTNTGTAIATVSTSSSQTIGIGGNSLTSVQVFPGQKYKFLAQTDGTNLFWGCECVSMFGTVAQANLLAQAAAVTSVATFTPVSGVGTFEVGGIISVISETTTGVTLVLTFDDENGTARSLSLAPMGTVTTSNLGVGYYAYNPVTIRAGTGAAIVVKTTLQTGATISYDVSAYIKQLA